MLVSPIVSPDINKKAPKTLIINVIGAFCCCRGRDRTSKRQLAITQSSVVDPGRLLLDGSMLRLSRYPRLRDKKVCMPRFHHPTVFKNYSFEFFYLFPSFDKSKLKYWTICCKYFNQLF